MAQAQRKKVKSKKEKSSRQTKLVVIRSPRNDKKVTSVKSSEENKLIDENELVTKKNGLINENELTNELINENKALDENDLTNENKPTNENKLATENKLTNTKSSNAKSATTKTTNKSTKSTKKPSKKKKNEFDKSKNHLITDYYKVTKRKTSNKLKEEQDQLISHFIKNDIDDLKSLRIDEFKDKGKGIVTCKYFEKGSFICEYRGDLIDVPKAKDREKLYESKELGCYMYYFAWSNKQWCIDATADTGRFGRLINHSRKKPNLKTKLFILNNMPHLIFVALDDIEENTELLYDYGETNRCAIEAHPWIKNT